MDNRRPPDKDLLRPPSESAMRRNSESANRRTSDIANRRISDIANRRISDIANRRTSDIANRRISGSAMRRTSENPMRLSSEYPRSALRRSKMESFDLVEKKGGRHFYESEAYLEDDLVDIKKGRLPSVFTDTNYDPNQNRAPPNPIKPWMAYINLIRMLLGPGLMIMPLAISQSGMILGPIITLVMGAVLVHTQILLLQSLNEVCQQMRIPHITYRFGFRLAVLHGPGMFSWFGHNGRTIVALFTVLSQVGICTVFIIIVTDSLRDILDLQSTAPCLLIILIPFLLLEVFMTSMTHVSYVSSVGAVFTLMSIILMLITFFDEAPEDYELATKSLWRIFWAIGANFFNMSAVAVILALDKALVNPSVMTSKLGVINVGIMIPTVISMVVGCIAYWKLGTVEENVLRDLPLDETATTVILILFLVSLSLGFPVQCHPAVGTIAETIKYHDPNSVLQEHQVQKIKGFLRPAFLLVCFLIAYLVPHQGPFVAFVGNLCTSMLALTFPAMMDLCLRHPNRYGRFFQHLIKDIFIILFGILDWILGVYFCGYIIYIRIMSRNSPSYGYFEYY